jgi:hypothetical protein
VLDEAGGVGAVDGAVVVGEGEGELEAVLGGAVEDPGGWLGAAEAEDGDLGRVDDRGEVAAADAALVGDRERGALDVLARLRLRARSARSAISAAISWMLLRSASRTTGTIRPRSVSTAMPML